MQWPWRHMVFVVPACVVIRRMLVRPPALWPKAPRPEAILEFLTGRPWKGTRAEAREELSRLIGAATRSVRWPAVVAVQPESGTRSEVLDPLKPIYDSEIDDPLIWCVAASKATGSILMLHRRPDLDRLRWAKPMVLLFPWRSKEQ